MLGNKTHFKMLAIIVSVVTICTSFDTISLRNSQPIKFVKACGFDTTIDNMQCTPVGQEECKIISAYWRNSGTLDNTPVLYFSNDVPMGQVGLTPDFKICVVVNPKFLDKLNCANDAIIYHELGHIRNLHIFAPGALTKDNELSADYFAGVQMQENKCNNITGVSGIYKEVLPDKQHPPYQIRLDTFNSGFNFKRKPEYITYNILQKENEYEFSSNPDQTQKELKFDKKVPATRKTASYIGKTLGDLFKDSVALQFIITPHKKTFLTAAKDSFFDVFLSLRCRIPIPNSIFISSIESVAYVVDDDTFKQSVIQPSNENQDNFGFWLTRVYEHFPIITLVKFKDESFLTFKQEFTLTTKK